MEAVLDDVVLEAQGWPAPVRAQWLRYFRRPSERRRLEAVGHTVFVICDRATGAVLGTLSIDATRGSPTVGLILGPEARGRGIGLEALTGALPRLRARGLRTLTIETEEDNGAMRAIAERAGFHLTAHYTHALPDGSHRPAVRYLLDL